MEKAKSSAKAGESAGLGEGATFLSLDVEGAELRVLQTVDPARFRAMLGPNFASERPSSFCRCLESV